MKNQDQDQPTTVKWKNEYTAMLVSNLAYIIIFYLLMQIFS